VKKAVTCISAKNENDINIYELGFGNERLTPTCILLNNSEQNKRVMRISEAENGVKEKCIYNTSSKGFEENKIRKIFAQNNGGNQ